MPGIARRGVDTVAGALIVNAPGTVIVNGAPVALIGDLVAPHGLPPHNAATLVQGSSTVFVGGVSVCRQGDLASCGHPIDSGSSNVFCGV